LRRLEQSLPVRPGSRCIAIAQDRIREKRFLSGLGLEVAPHVVIESPDDLRDARIAGVLPGILKLSRSGYDGKGQRAVTSEAEIRATFADWNGTACVLEKRIGLRMELSVLLARDAAGQTAVWPVAENRHASGILDLSIVPARVSSGLAAAARDAALQIAHALEYCGVLCVEFFVDEAGALLVNEIAPRPHNSGHHSMESCHVSQFEQQVRVLADLPLGDPGLRSAAVMQNLLGDLWRDGAPAWDAVLGATGAQLHLYGKAEPRPGRKMGHYTCIAPSTEQALATANRIRAALSSSDSNATPES
jgi:5-(carboxyamino)imidazole ribonucleotide synthase